MKVAFLAVVGFALGMLLAWGERTAPLMSSKQVQSLVQIARALMHPADSVASSDQPLSPPEPPVAQSRPLVAPPKNNSSREAAHLRPAIEPIYLALFGSLDDGKALAVAIEETAELERLLAVSPPDAAGEAAKRVGLLMKAARIETSKVAEAKAQPVSNALGGGAPSMNFFGGVAERRWRANMAALAKRCGSEWRRFIELDASASYSPEFRGAVERLLAERHIRDLERSAKLIEGRVLHAMESGALIEDQSNLVVVFVAGLNNVADDAGARVLGHRSGVYRYKTDGGASRTVERYVFYREAK